MSKNIIFTKTVSTISDEYQPKPSSVFLPEWYKKTSSYVGPKKEVLYSEETNATIKKCIPVFDALTTGYIIPTYCDLWISKTSEGIISYRSAGDVKAVSFHSIQQSPYHPNMNMHPYPKFLNPWSIKTPKGYSSLIINPVHKGNAFLTIFEGVVDTDNYSPTINFPFILNDSNFEGLIPAGTPLVQIIPIKREAWKQKIGSEKNLLNVRNNENILSSRFFDRYKTMFWNRKEYK